MYDHNGLELTPAAESLNTYRRTAVSIKDKKYIAYAQANRTKGNNQWALFRIGKFNDPRDAAFIGQEFDKQYNKDQIRQMVTDGTFDEIAKDFIKTTELPEWKFPAEGLLIEDILGDYGKEFKMNYVNNARDAIVEIIKVYGIKTPSLKEVPEIVKKVEAAYNTGIGYRAAAKQVMGV